MKRIFLPIVLLCSSAPAFAGGITSSITDSVQLTVNGSAVQTERLGSSYSVSGSNISVTALGGLTGGTSSAAATVSAGDYGIDTDGSAFTFSESSTIGDATVTSQTVASGAISSPTLYGHSTTQSAGDAGNLAGSLSATSVASVTAGGAGTTAIGQRTVELSVFE